MTKLQQEVGRATEERVSLETANLRLRQEQAKVHRVMAEERNHIRKEVQDIATILRQTTTKLAQDLGTGVQKALREVEVLTSGAVELGKELGRSEATIEANEWLQTLFALVEDGDGVSATQVRAVVLTVLGGALNWFEKEGNEFAPTIPLKSKVWAALEECQRWRA